MKAKINSYDLMSDTFNITCALPDSDVDNFGIILNFPAYLIQLSDQDHEVETPEELVDEIVELTHEAIDYIFGIG